MAERATIRDVAGLAGVSVGTISNYLTSKKPISARARQSIEAAIDELGFIPNSAVRVMHGQRTSAVAFMIPDSSNPFFAEVGRGVEHVAVQAGMVVVVCNTDGDDARENQYAQTLSELRIAGAIVTPLSAAENNLRQLDASGAAIVVLGTGEQPHRYPSVDVDDTAGGYLAGQHLVERGRRDLVFFGGPGGDPQIHARFEGLRLAVVESGGDPNRIRRIDSAGNTGAQRREAARRILDLDPAPTGVFCANDLLAMALESSALAAGRRIPEDLEVVGYDDIDSAETAPVPLTTIRQPQFEIGVAAATLLLSRARGDLSGESVSFAPTLIERASTTSRADLPSRSQAAV